MERRQLQLLLDDAESIKKSYSGLEVKELVSHFISSNAPTFKEAASIIRMCHEAVQHYDGHLLNVLPVEKYIKDSVLMVLSHNNLDIQGSIARTWDSPKREAKALRILRLAGVNETDQVRGREVPGTFVDRFLSLPADEVLDFLRAG